MRKPRSHSPTSIASLRGRWRSHGLNSDLPFSKLYMFPLNLLRGLRGSQSQPRVKEAAASRSSDRPLIPVEMDGSSCLLPSLCSLAGLGRGSWGWCEGNISTAQSEQTMPITFDRSLLLIASRPQPEVLACFLLAAPSFNCFQIQQPEAFLPSTQEELSSPSPFCYLSWADEPFILRTPKSSSFIGTDYLKTGPEKVRNTCYRDFAIAGFWLTVALLTAPAAQEP